MAQPCPWFRVLGCEKESQKHNITIPSGSIHQVIQDREVKNVKETLRKYKLRYELTNSQEWEYRTSDSEEENSEPMKTAADEEMKSNVVRVQVLDQTTQAPIDLGADLSLFLNLVEKMELDHFTSEAVT